MKWAMAGTWVFSIKGLEVAAKMLDAGEHRLDALEQAIRVVEDDPTVESVGSFALPNADGIIECDAALMDGADLSFGGVASLSGIAHAVSVARAVMASPHTMMVGQGAYQFARQRGFAPAAMLSDERKQQWQAEYEKRKAGGTLGLDTHDTIGYVVRDASGHLAAGTSTSGLFFKLPGRVGDSPLPGCGLFADDERGAAVATGVGEDIMRGVVCERVVTLLEQGMPPQQAAEQVIYNLHRRRAGAGYTVGNLSLICMNTKGEIGAATTREGGFPMSYAVDGDIEERLYQPVIGTDKSPQPYVKTGV